MRTSPRRVGASAADIELSSGPAEIHRYHRRRSVTIQAELHGTSQDFLQPLTIVSALLITGHGFSLPSLPGLLMGVVTKNSILLVDYSITAIRAPMAVAVIGGLITSTMLSLIVVPVCSRKSTICGAHGERHPD